MYLEEVVISIDEYEAIRLKDLEGLQQEEAAAKMGISQPTFYRLLTSARKKIAAALVMGKAIKIEGGTFILEGNPPHLVPKPVETYHEGDNEEETE
jgi:predicted DNA-binding protein (UPF0251 family)